MAFQLGEDRSNGSKVIVFLSKFKMAAAAILDFVMESQEVPTVILCYEVYVDLEFDENQLIGSKVTAVFQNIDFGLDFSI